MYVVHFKRRSAILTLAGVVLAAVLALVLAGCFGGKQAESVTLADDAARVEYLTQLGWQADSQPMETLDLQLPENLEKKWGDYTALQKQQGFPFADYALAAAPAYRTVGIHHHGVGFQENINKSFLQSLQIYSIGCRCDQEANVRMNLSSF